VKFPASYNGVWARIKENKGVFPILTRANAFFNLILGRYNETENQPKAYAVPLLEFIQGISRDV
jgi:hypothetical protein